MNTLNQVPVIMLGAMLLTSSPVHAEIDITERVIQQTELDETIAQLCVAHCQGNRRQGRLRSMAVQRTDSNLLWVHAFASLKNHHHQDTFIGGGFAVYNFTMDVHATGTLDTDSCMLTIDDIVVSNDQTGLLNDLAGKEIGKTHRIENCAAIVDGI